MSSLRLLRSLRRLSQVFCMALFIWLLLATFYHGVVEGDQQAVDALPYPVSLFLQFDPLAALSMLFATGTLYEDLLWSLVIVVLTIFLGRVFCGWICPLGALSQFVAWIGSRRLTKKRIALNQSGRHQRIKYMILFFFLGGALFGTLQVGLLDPLCLLIRSLGLSILPAFDNLLRTVLDLLSGESELARSGHGLLDDYFLGPRSLTFYGGSVLGLLFIGILLLNRLVPRFFCRFVCPLGALLGLLSRFSLLSLKVDREACTNCGLCAAGCQGAAGCHAAAAAGAKDSGGGGAAWRSAECLMCFNCTASCKQGAVSFGFHVPEEGRESGIGLSRRGFLASSLAGAACVPLVRASAGPPRHPAPELIRPPGACGEEEFLDRCIKCGQCMKVCPNHAIHPAALQGGLEGIWSPVVIPRIGYCEPSCNLCSQVCPTGAIRAFTEEDKKANKVRIGTAFFDVGLCIPWSQGRPCMVCEEFCPPSPKAIWFETMLMTRSDGTTAEIPLPRVEPERCTGCGGCEKVCPLPDRSAIRVTSRGESRHKNRVSPT